MNSTSNDSATREADDAAARKVKERVLVFIVAFLGLLIVAGITAVVLRIIYLSSTGPAQRTASQPEGQPAAAAGQAAQDRLDLPAGAVVKSISVNGDRLAVHYEAPEDTGIAVLDLATGAVVRRVEVVPAGPGR
jgi:hypothetical protein